MKKKLLLFVVLLANAMGVFAQEIVYHDILQIQNVKNVVKGYTGSFDLVLTGNSETFTALAIDIQLPEGVTYSSYAKGPLLTDHGIATSSQGSNTTRISASSTSADPDFTATEGVVMTIFFTVESNFTNQNITLSNIKFTLGGQNYFAGDANGLVTETISSGNHFTFSDSETPNLIEMDNADVTIERTLKAGKWNTIVLPFAMNATQIADDDAFGSSAVVAEFSGVTYTTSGWSVTGITFSFNTVSAIEANKPYIIKVNSNMSSFKAEGVNLPASASPSSVSFNDPVQGAMLNASFIGTYTPGFTIPENGLYISDNMFKYTQGTTKLKAFRAYIKPSMPLSDKTLSSSSRSISFTIDGETTGIYNVEDGTVEGGKYFNLKGQRVTNPTKGVYVVDGKNVMVK